MTETPKFDEIYSRGREYIYDLIANAARLDRRSREVDKVGELADEMWPEEQLLNIVEMFHVPALDIMRAASTIQLLRQGVSGWASLQHARETRDELLESVHRNAVELELLCSMIVRAAGDGDRTRHLRDDIILRTKEKLQRAIEHSRPSDLPADDWPGPAPLLCKVCSAELVEKRLHDPQGGPDCVAYFCPVNREHGHPDKDQGDAETQVDKPELASIDIVAPDAESFVRRPPEKKGPISLLDADKARMSSMSAGSSVSDQRRIAERSIEYVNCVSCGTEGNLRAKSGFGDPFGKSTEFAVMCSGVGCDFAIENLGPNGWSKTADRAVDDWNNEQRKADPINAEED